MRSKFHSTTRPDPAVHRRFAGASLAGIGVAAALLAGLALPATAADPHERQQPSAASGGAQRVGVVRNHYVRLANNLLVDAARAPGADRDAKHFVDVEFPQDPTRGTNAILAQLVDVADVQVGDIVEIRIAHRDNPKFFPVKEVTKVTEVVAKSDTALARAFVRGITLASRSVTPLEVLSQAGRRMGIGNTAP